ncbi:MarR family winged helix-turn-helix transcriptional regulator [Solibacillus sp. FSL K6-1523]|uniref:MarR family winged helix-turn-helix transcriptional regulator n=1 Tax=Solibacillus sp. FSL K6-1523 TaxID=2921471 RepID=UPI0030F9B126
MTSMEQMKQIILLMKSIDRQVTMQFEKQTDISMTRYELLCTLLDGGTVSQQVLKQAIEIDQAAITRHLKLLEEEHFVMRSRNTDNNREMLVSLTEEGRARLVHCQDDKNDYFKNLTNEFSEQDLQMLYTLLEKLKQNSDKRK